MRLLAISVACGVLLATPAMAQTICGDRAKMVKFMAEKYQETRAGLGIAKGGAVVELFTADTGTWTMLITLPPPDGRTCVVGSGEGWQMHPRPEPTNGDPA